MEPAQGAEGRRRGRVQANVEEAVVVVVVLVPALADTVFAQSVVNMYLINWALLVMSSIVQNVELL